MRIQTKRLDVVALSSEQLALYLVGENFLEKELGLLQTDRSVIPGIRARVERGILADMRRTSGDDYLFLTFWIVISRDEKRIVAELGFKGPPDKHGAVEIGYGTLPATRNMGFMTEAVQALAGWAATQPSIKTIIAETDQDNLASIRVLEKSGFSFLYNRGSMKWWQLTVKAETAPRYNYAE